MKKKIKRLAIFLARKGHPHPWRWARKIANCSWDDLLDEEEKTGWKVWTEDYYCPTCEDYHVEFVGLISPSEKRYEIMHNGVIKEVIE